jgi:hypothetical protein
MAVEARKRSTRIPGIAESPSQPARSEAQLLDNDWPQFMADSAAGSPCSRHSTRQITRAKVFCPALASYVTHQEANFATCRSSATVCYLLSLAHELTTPPGILSTLCRKRIVAAACLSTAKGKDNRSTDAKIESR